MVPQPSLWLTLLAFVCAIGPLVFFHELGHYLVARLFRIPAEVFSIGFGHEIVGWTDRQGTRWKIGWLPLGGYVRFVGDMSPASNPAELENVPPADRHRTFQLRPVWQRFLVVRAGPAANFLLAIIIFAAFFAMVGVPRDSTNIVGEVQAKSAAADVGIQPGDRILSVEGRETPTFDDIRKVVTAHPDATVVIKVQRGQSIREFPATLKSEKAQDPSGRPVRKGILGVVPVMQRMPANEAIATAVKNTVKITASIVVGVGQIITGQISAKAIGGPITIAQVAGQGASLGPSAFVVLLALLSINLGFINLLPVPMLDGGHLFFYAVEAVRRRPISAQALNWAFRGGLAVILTLLLFTTINDLGSIGLWDRLQRLIG